MASKKKSDIPKKPGWDWIRDEIYGASRLTTLSAECKSKHEILEFLGVAAGGRQLTMLKQLALGADVILPVTRKEETMRRMRSVRGDKLEVPSFADNGDVDALQARFVAGLTQEDPARQIEILLRTNSGLLRQVRKLQDHKDLVRRCIEESVTPLKAIEPKFSCKPGHGIDEEIMIFNISDIQGGQFVFGYDTGGLEHYSWDVFCERVERYKHGVNRFVNDILRKSYPIRRALVIINGDVVEGENIYPLQWSRIDMAAMQQVAAVGGKLVEILAYIASIFDYVEVLCVYGNHGGVKETRINLDWFVYALIEQAFRAQPHVDVFVSDSHFMAFWLGPKAKVVEHLDWSDIPNTVWNYNVLHGDNIPRYLSLPYYGLERVELRYMKMTGIIYDGTFVAHHHRAAAIEDKYINGSWVAGNEFSVRVMQGVSQPTQKWFLWHPKQGITLEGHIKLAKRPRLSIDEGTVANIYTPVTQGAFDMNAGALADAAGGIMERRTPMSLKRAKGEKK